MFFNYVSPTWAPRNKFNQLYFCLHCNVIKPWANHMYSTNLNKFQVYTYCTFFQWYFTQKNEKKKEKN